MEKVSRERFNGERHRGRMLVVGRLFVSNGVVTLVIGNWERKRLKHVSGQRRESRPGYYNVYLSVVSISPLFLFLLDPTTPVSARFVF